MFEEALAGCAEAERAVLSDLIATVRRAAPDATEGRSYGMPAFLYRDRPLLGFAVHAEHLGLYPFSPEVLASVADRLEGFERTKGAVRFVADRPLPSEVVTAMVRGRVAEIDGRSG